MKNGIAIGLGLALGLSVATFVLLTVAHTQKWEILLAMALEGIGFGLAFASMSNLVVAAVPREQTGVAIYRGHRKISLRKIGESRTGEDSTYRERRQGRHHGDDRQDVGR